MITTTVLNHGPGFSPLFQNPDFENIATFEFVHSHPVSKKYWWCRLSKMASRRRNRGFRPPALAFLTWLSFFYHPSARQNWSVEQNWIVEFSWSKSLFLDRICKFQKLLQFFQFIESCHSEITFVCATFGICSIQGNQYFVEVKIKG